MEIHPKVSVCIPSYNQNKYIETAIESVLNQSYSNLELVIVDDCSTDGTIDLIKSFDDSRIRFYQNNINLGIPANFNRCLSKARGKYVLILGGDDFLNEKLLEREIPLLDSDETIGLVHTDMIAIDDVGNVIEGHWNKIYNEDSIVSGEKVFIEIMLHGNFICLNSALVRKECFFDEYQSGFNQKSIYTFDSELWLRIALSYNIVYINAPLASHRRYNKQFGSTLDKDKIFADRIYIRLNVLYKYRKKISNWKGLKRELSDIYFRKFVKLNLNHLAKRDVGFVLNNLYTIALLFNRDFLWRTRKKRDSYDHS